MRSAISLSRQGPYRIALVIFAYFLVLISVSACSGNAIHRWRTADDEKAGLRCKPECKFSSKEISGASAREGDPDRINPSARSEQQKLEKLCASMPIECGGEANSGEFELLFLEFDEQGRLFSDEQMDEVFKHLDALAEKDRLSLYVFVHGWFGGSAANDQNVVEARRTLLRFAQIEKSRDERLFEKGYEENRKVVGLLIGWPGTSINMPLIRYLSFWDRKATATDVAGGSIREVFSRLRQFQQRKNQSGCGCKGLALPETKLGELITYDDKCVRQIVIAHSFGASITFNAIAGTLLDEVIRGANAMDGESACDKSGSGIVLPFADLVVLVNAAVEGERYEALHQAIRNRARRAGFCPQQFPVVVAVTAESDWATRVAFPYGRIVNSIFEREKPQIAISRADFGDVGRWMHGAPQTGLTGAADDQQLSTSEAHEICKQYGDATKPKLCALVSNLVRLSSEEEHANKQTIGHIGRYKNLNLSTTDAESAKIDSSPESKTCNDLKTNRLKIETGVIDRAKQVVFDCACDLPQFKEVLKDAPNDTACFDAASEVLAMSYVRSQEYGQCQKGFSAYFAQPRLFCGGMLLDKWGGSSEDEEFDGARPVWIINSSHKHIIDGHSDYADFDNQRFPSFMVQLHHDQVLPLARPLKYDAAESLRTSLLEQVSRYCLNTKSQEDSGP